MRTKVSGSVLLYLGILLCFDKSETAYAEERYEVINATYISRSEAKRAEQRMEGIFTVSDRNTGSINNCVCAIVYDRNSGATVTRSAECKPLALGDIQPAPGHYTFYGPGKGRPVTASGSPDFASIVQDTGKLRFCTYLEKSGRYTCVEAPLKF
jgi:hypothetical protein